VGEDRVVFTFLPTHRALRDQFEQAAGWLRELATRVAGRPIAVSAAQADEPLEVAAGETEVAEAAAETPPRPAARDLKAEALASSTVQAVLEVFPAEIRDVEEV
jgi:hypothetical protein